MEIKYSKEHFIKDLDIGKDYAVMVQYHNYNSELWGVIIRALYDRYNEIDKKDMSADIKNMVKAEIELETLSKAMELIEALYSIIESLDKEESRVQDTIIDFHMTKKIKEKYRTISDNEKEYFIKLFTYPNIDDLPLNNNEKTILKLVYDSNIKVIKEGLMIINEFYEKNYTVYNKHKHSKPMFIGFPYPYKDNYALTIIMSRNDNKKIQYNVLFHSEMIMKRYVNLVKFIITLIKDLLNNRIIYLDSRGFKQPVFQLYFEFSDKVKEIIEIINKKVADEDKRTRTKVPIDFEYPIPKEYIDEEMLFYEDMAKRMKIGKNNELEELVYKMGQ